MTGHILRRYEKGAARTLADRASSSPAGFARSVARLLRVPLLLALLAAGLIAAVDPYWMFGAPSVPGINESRPLYEANVVQVKPYQLRRLRPKAVALGSSRSEVGLSPEHPGWADSHAFNFAIPAANSYEVMLAFLHAQAVAAPLKQAVVGLDFLSFNVYRKVGPAFNEERFAWDDLKAFADFLDATLAERRARAPVAPAAPPVPTDQPTGDERLYPAPYPDIARGVARGQFGSEYEHDFNGRPAEGRNYSAVPTEWDEKLYLALYPAVATVVGSGQFGSGYEHYLKIGRTEGRLFPTIPADWDERLYLALYLDVAAAVSNGGVPSGYVHYVQAGRAEGRLFAKVPPDWDEKYYLTLYPDVAAVVASGQFGSGYEHYLKNGRAEGRHYGGIPTDWDEKLYLALYPDVAAVVATAQFGSGHEHYLKNGRTEGRLFARVPPDWDEKYYITLYPDVAAVVGSGQFGSGYEHYLKNGRAEGRHYGSVPTDWNEELYLVLYTDVAAAIFRGDVPSGYAHYVRAGKAEGRSLPDWNEVGYLAANPGVRIAIARGQYRTGFIHYAAVGRSEGRVGGLPPANLLEWLELKWPPLHSWLFKAKELGQLTFSAGALRDAIKTISQQAVPASFSERGQRIWHGQDEVLLRMGGTGKAYRRWISASSPWKIFWFDPPERMYCLSHPHTYMSGLDPFRFMVRRAHADGTELHLFVSPLPASIRKIIDAAELGGRFEFWLRELVRINEEEADRAGRKPFSLWDFSDTNSITGDPVPAADDPTPMHWFWEVSHYRRITGDLVLDRVFGVRDSSRPLPDDFGVRLTALSIDEHLERSRTKRAEWEIANPDLTELINKAARPPREDRQREATCW